MTRDRLIEIHRQVVKEFEMNEKHIWADLERMFADAILAEQTTHSITKEEIEAAALEKYPREQPTFAMNQNARKKRTAFAEGCNWLLTTQSTKKEEKVCECSMEGSNHRKDYAGKYCTQCGGKVYLLDSQKPKSQSTKKEETEEELHEQFSDSNVMNGNNPNLKPLSTQPEISAEKETLHEAKELIKSWRMAYMMKETGLTEDELETDWLMYQGANLTMINLNRAITTPADNNLKEQAAVQEFEFTKWVGEMKYTKHQTNDRWYDSDNEYSLIGTTKELFELFIQSKTTIA